VKVTYVIVPALKVVDGNVTVCWRTPTIKSKPTFVL
jgi:hypothetical protein